jgi:hypothetical protein
VSNPIVTFYSLGGNTRRLATEAARRLGCPLMEIRDTRSRHGAFGYLRSGFEALSRRCPEIQPIEGNVADFGLLIIGTPVWVGHLSSPVRSFLTLHRPRIRTLAAFCTMGGRDPVSTFADIASAAGQAPIATLAMSERDWNTPEFEGKLNAFVAALAARGQS